MSADSTLTLATNQPERGAHEPHFSTTIEASKGWAPLNLGALWRYRELLYFLMWRDIKVRYKQTVFGATWAIIQPVVTMVIFTFVFGRLANVPSDGVPYPIFSYCGLLPWTFFATALSRSSSSLVGNASLISKIYFPRLILPLSSALAGLLDVAIAFVVLLGLMLFYHVPPTATIVALPLFLLLAVAAALAVGLWLSALNVRYRDVGYVVPFLTQIWLYATPIAYPASLIKGNLRLILALNPMAGVVEGFRWAILSGGGFHTTRPSHALFGVAVADPTPASAPWLDIPTLAISTAITLVALAGGLYYFRRMEQQFADVV